MSLYCNAGEEWHHPECIDVGITDEVKKNANDFKCSWCDPHISFINKLKKKEGAASSKPEELLTLVANDESGILQHIKMMRMKIKMMQCDPNELLLV